MFGLAIEVATKGAESKLGEAIHKMIAEDPTLQVERVAATHQTVLRGLGEQHLRIKLRLLEERYGVKVNTEPPKGRLQGNHHQQGRGPSPPQETDRRRGTVRRSVSARRTAQRR
jgi:translation elongation factor EF-G